MLSPLFDSTLTDEPVPFAPPQWINIVAVISIVGTMLLAIFIYFGLILAALTTLATALAFYAWLQRGYESPVSRRILPIYIGTVIANLIQGAEQHHSDYAGSIKAMYPDLIAQTSILSSFNFAAAFSLTAVSLYLFAGAALFYQTRIGSFMAWWLFTWSIVFPFSHYLMPLFATTGYTYMPGMITAPLLISLGLIGANSLHIPTIVGGE